MAIKILACDPATHFGWAYSPDGASIGAGGVFDLSVRRDESGGMRLVRLVGKLNEIMGSLGIDLLVFEAARNAGPVHQGALVVQAEIQGVIKHWCEERRIQYRGYSPTEIKRHATGKGNSGKPLMLAAAEKMWPEVEIEDDNHADAMWLLDLAIRDYGQGIMG